MILGHNLYLLIGLYASQTLLLTKWRTDPHLRSIARTSPSLNQGGGIHPTPFPPSFMLDKEFRNPQGFMILGVYPEGSF